MHLSTSFTASFINLQTTNSTFNTTVNQRIQPAAGSSFYNSHFSNEQASYAQKNEQNSAYRIDVYHSQISL